MKSPAGGRKALPSVDIAIGAAAWRRKPQAKKLIRKAISAAARATAKSGSTTRAELAILLADDSAMRALNRQWRNRNTATNVLSFPAVPPDNRTRKRPRHLGDLVVAYETTAREAVADRKSFDHHLVHLVVHGYLHLLGYDHADDREAEKMERLETRILARLGVPDPYGGSSFE
jgi:probable rRNA maturation factor